MADSVGPFATNPWAEADWMRQMGAAMPSGVIGAPAASATAGSLAFSSSGLTVTLTAGAANVGGAGFSRAAPLTSTAVTANTNGTLSRRDRIVLRRDLATHTVTPVVIAGTPAATPVAPALVSTSTQQDLAMFSFLVPPASGTSLTGIVDERTWVDPAGYGAQIANAGRAAITITGKVGTTTALLPAVTVPAAPYACRVVFSALGRSGFDDVAQSVAWDWDSLPSSATNVSQDETTQVNVGAAQWVTVVSSVAFDVPAFTVATARLILRTSGSVYNRGGVTWVRSLAV